MTHTASTSAAISPVMARPGLAINSTRRGDHAEPKVDPRQPAHAPRLAASGA